MPTYEYRCPNGHDVERFFRKISDAAAEVECPTCGATAARRMSAGGGLLFKGSGFYLTDYGRNAHRSSGAPGAPSGTGGEGGGGDGGKAGSGDAGGSSGGSGSDSGAGAGKGSPGGAGSGASSGSGGSSSGSSGSGSSGGGASPAPPASKPAPKADS